MLTSSALIFLIMIEGNVLVQYSIMSSAHKMASLGGRLKLSAAVHRLTFPPIPSQDDFPWEVAKNSMSQQC